MKVALWPVAVPSRLPATSLLQKVTVWMPFPTENGASYVAAGPPSTV